MISHELLILSSKSKINEKQNKNEKEKENKVKSIVFNSDIIPPSLIFLL